MQQVATSSAPNAGCLHDRRSSVAFSDNDGEPAALTASPQRRSSRRHHRVGSSGSLASMDSLGSVGSLHSLAGVWPLLRDCLLTHETSSHPCQKRPACPCLHILVILQSASWYRKPTPIIASVWHSVGQQAAGPGACQSAVAVFTYRALECQRRLFCPAEGEPSDAGDADAWGGSSPAQGSPARPRRPIPSSASLNSLESASSYGSNLSDGCSHRDYRAVIKGARCLACHVLHQQTTMLNCGCNAAMLLTARMQ